MEEFFGRIFWEDILGGYFGKIFWEDFLEDFFGRNSLFILLKSANLFDSKRD